MVKKIYLKLTATVFRSTTALVHSSLPTSGVHDPWALSAVCCVLPAAGVCPAGAWAGIVPLPEGADVDADVELSQSSRTGFRAT